MKKFTFVDLFSGIGGFHLALKSLGGEFVGGCEIDENARLTYLANYKIDEKIFHHDIHSIDPLSIPTHDILCAGFPCQPFSISGKKKALEDTRSFVISPMLKIIEIKKPPFIILENVKHLKYIEDGKVLNDIQESLKGMGYYVATKILNAKDFGVPQNRERLVIIGTKSQPFDFPVPQYENTSIENILEATQEEMTFLESGLFTLIPEPKRQKDSGLIFCGYRNKDIRKKGVREGTIHLSRVHKQPNRIYSIEGTHPTIPSQETSGRFWIKLKNNQVRKLTIKECYRLMGFPDSFMKPVSVGHQYKQIGNSVCVPMVAFIAKHLLADYLKK